MFYLIKKGLKVAASNAALRKAAKHDNTDTTLALALIKKGAELYEKNNGGTSPQDPAASHTLSSRKKGGTPKIG